MKIEGNISGFYVEAKFHVANWGTNCPSIVKICVPKTGAFILLASYRARACPSEMNTVFLRIEGQFVPQSENCFIAKIIHLSIDKKTVPCIARFRFS